MQKRCLRRLARQKRDVSQNSEHLRHWVQQEILEHPADSISKAGVGPPCSEKCVVIQQILSVYNWQVLGRPAGWAKRTGQAKQIKRLFEPRQTAEDARKFRRHVHWVWLLWSEQSKRKRLINDNSLILRIKYQLRAEITRKRVCINLKRDFWWNDWLKAEYRKR